MSRFMLDTDTSSFIIKRRPDSVRRRLNSVGIGAVCLSSVTLGELRFGAARASDPTATSAAIDEFVRYLEVLAWDDRAADAYGPLRARLVGAGRPIGPLDEMIAAHALSVDAILVTGNRRHFERVEELSVDTWN